MGNQVVLSKGKRKPADKEYNIKKYDFQQPKLVSKEIMRGLHKIHNLFSRQTKRILANALNLEIETTLENIEQVLFAEFLTSLETPTALFLFNIEEFGEWALLQIDPSFCVYFVEHQSGGRPEEFRERRSLTNIEERVVGRIIDKLLNELAHLWSPYIDMTILHHAYESKPTNVRSSSHIPGIKVSFKLEVEQMETSFQICYPYVTLKEKLTDSFGVLNEDNNKESLSSNERKQLKKEMKSINVTAQAILGEKKVPIRKIQNLSEGDLIKLDQHINNPLSIKVNKKLKFKGYPGVQNGKKAVKIFDVLAAIK